MRTLLICLTILLGSLIIAEQVHRLSLTEKEKAELIVAEDKKAELSALRSQDRLEKKLAEAKEKEEILHLAKGLSFEKIMGLPKNQKNVVLESYAEKFVEIAALLLLGCIMITMTSSGVNKLVYWVGKKESGQM